MAEGGRRGDRSRKTYSETYDLLYRREATCPNELWQADHTLLDIWALDEDDHPVRPWLSVIIDDYSRAIPGFLLSLQAPSAIQTALVLRQGIWRKTEPHWPICGIPQRLYVEYVPRHISTSYVAIRVMWPCGCISCRIKAEPALVAT